nr:ORF2 [Torque teno Leptonychotes weddellii virus 1]
MALCAATSTHGYPDLHHPLQFRKAEALWKRECVASHARFCACGNFLAHFRWPSTGGSVSGDLGGQDGGEKGAISTGEEEVIPDTMGEEEDGIPDSELLQ